MNRFPYRHFGASLKKQRIEKGVSQISIATDLGYKSAQIISNVERGMCHLPDAKIGELAKLLNVCPDMLLGLKQLDLEKKRSRTT